jgi:collagen triple helix repeat protein
MKQLILATLLLAMAGGAYAEEDDDKGPAGPQGPQGIQGVAGPTGAIGPMGIKGTTGNTGTPGTSGPVGATGNTGNTGVAGAKGATGPSGSQGVAGAVGSQGPSGATAPEIDPRIDVEVREYDAQHWAISSFASFGMQDGTSRYIVGQKLVLKLGQSYEERLINKLKAGK